MVQAVTAKGINAQTIPVDSNIRSKQFPAGGLRRTPNATNSHTVIYSHCGSPGHTSASHPDTAIANPFSHSDTSFTNAYSHSGTPLTDAYTHSNTSFGDGYTYSGASYGYSYNSANRNSWPYPNCEAYTYVDPHS